METSPLNLNDFWRHMLFTTPEWQKFLSILVHQYKYIMFFIQNKHYKSQKILKSFFPKQDDQTIAVKRFTLQVSFT